MVCIQDDGTIEFGYFRPGASTVRLSGEFNDWSQEGQTMVKDEAGWFRTRLKLPSGEYRFKYLVDGELWEADFAAFGVESDKQGGWHSVLMVRETEQRSMRIAA